MLLNRIFYTLKPTIPRRLQIFLRRQIAKYKCKKYAHIWPIDPEAGDPPEGWKGWPDGKKFALVLSHDVDILKGYNNVLKLAELEERLGFRSSFNFVPERYIASESLFEELRQRGFEVGVHGLKHDGRLFSSHLIFEQRAVKINNCLRKWRSMGFTSPSMHHNLSWMHALNIEYCTSTFDTDPFEPQPDGLGTIFPIWISNNSRKTGYVELPYTLPQDFTLFVIMKECNIQIWKEKLDWIAENGGMALLNTHPDYMNFEGAKLGPEEYPTGYYEEFLTYVKTKFEGKYWHALPKEVARFQAKGQGGKSLRGASRKAQKKIWIDLDNSPHVPFFNPIIKELKKRGHEVTLTARDCFQVCGLADLLKLQYTSIGRHYGKTKILKAAGTIIRSLQMLPFALREKPALAVSHGSRSQLLTALMLRIPSLVLIDYEHARGLLAIKPNWIVAPEVIPDSAIFAPSNRILRYPGLKEDVYVPELEPDPTILRQLGIRNGDLLVTIRPPATEAHYHNPESEKLFVEVVNFLGSDQDVRMAILPRNSRKQTDWIRNTWPEWCSNGKIIIPDHVVNGLNLIWHSALVVSGGGTMNREAAALGVPVYSIFQGRIGAVDQYLSNIGRLVLLKSVDDIPKKLKLSSRNYSTSPAKMDNTTRQKIVEHIEAIMVNNHPGKSITTTQIRKSSNI